MPMNQERSLEDWVDAYIETHLEPKERWDDNDPHWWAVERAMVTARQVEPEDIWTFILAVHAKNPPEHAHHCLAAGPLEDLIGYFGPDFIDRIEVMAHQDQAFRELLGSVWEPYGVDAEVWRRVAAARGEA